MLEALRIVRSGSVDAISAEAYVESPSRAWQDLRVKLARPYNRGSILLHPLAHAPLVLQDVYGSTVAGEVQHRTYALGFVLSTVARH